MESTEVRVGVVGAGWIGRQHCASLRRIPAARVVAVSDIDEERSRQLAGECGARSFPDWQQLLDAEAIDALVVATPTGSHAPAAVAALERGLGVFIEKPIARTSADAHTIVLAAERNGAICAVGYQWRALGALATLKAELASRRAGMFLSRSIGSTQVRDWFADRRQTAGLLFERASHEIDLQQALGGKVLSAQALEGDVRLFGPEGPAGSPASASQVLAITLKFASGTIGLIGLCSVARGDPQRFDLTVATESGTFELFLDPSFELNTELRYAGAPAPAEDDRYFREVHRSLHVSEKSLEDPFVGEMRMFVDAVRSGRPEAVACTARDGADTLAVALAAEESLSTGLPVAVA